MSYTRFEIDPGLFADIMPEGAKLYKRPELPKIQFERGRQKFTVSDFRLLHPLGVQAVDLLLNAMIQDPESGEASLRIGEGVTDDEIAIVTDIVMGFEYETHKGGKNGFMIGGFLFFSTQLIKPEDGDGELKVSFDKVRAKYLSEYVAEQHGREKVGVFEMVLALCDKEVADMKAGKGRIGNMEGLYYRGQCGARDSRDSEGVTGDDA